MSSERGNVIGGTVLANSTMQPPDAAHRRDPGRARASRAEPRVATRPVPLRSRNRFTTSAADYLPANRSGIDTGRLILLQLVLAAVFVAAVLAGESTAPLVLVVAGTGLALLVLAFGRAGGRWWTVSWRLRRQLARRLRRQPVPDPDPRITAARRICPALTVRTVEDRDQLIGVAGDGSGWFSVLALAPADVLTLPVARLTRLLTDRDVRLDAVQVLIRTVAAGVGEGPAARSYRELAGPVPPPVSRQCWVALRFDPRLDEAAVRRRGGEIAGVQRVLTASATRAVRQLRAAGIDAAPLDRDGLLACLARSLVLIDAGTDQSSRPGADAEPFVETWQSVRTGPVEHVVYRVVRWPDLAEAGGRLPALLSDIGVNTDVSVVLRPLVPGQTVVELAVRLSGPPAAVALAGENLQALASRANAVLRRADGEHGPAMFVTAPTGGGPW